MGGEAVGVMCCMLLVVVPIALLIGAAILRGGVSFANKCLPKNIERESYDEWDDYDRSERPASLIPEPALGKAMAIVFLNAILGIIIQIPINLLLGIGFINMGGGQDPLKELIASLIQLPIGFLVNAGLLSAMLPTSFPRACLVVLFEYLIVLVIAIIILVPLFVLAIALRR